VKDNGKSEKMQIRRPGTKGYEEVEGTVSITTPQSPNNGTTDINSTHMAPEFELASVSVVPDGQC
jgi:hypothetical protein